MREKRKRHGEREKLTGDSCCCAASTPIVVALLHLPLVVSVYQANKFAQIVAGNIHDSCVPRLASVASAVSAAAAAATVAAGRLPLPFAGPLNISEIGNFALDDGPQIGPHNEDKADQATLQLLLFSVCPVTNCNGA